MNHYMQGIQIKNPELIEVLEEATWFMKNKELLNTHLHRNGGVFTDGEKFVSEEFKWKVINEGRAHDGFPECASGFNIKPDQIKYISFNEDIANNYDNVNSQLMIFFGTRHNALFHIYPPGGFLSWHNNANASAYNLIFTYNPTGNGYFAYHDWEKNETVKVIDPKGWSCKYGYFGNYNEPREKLVYHCAYSPEWRMTISYIYDHRDSEVGKEFQKQVIEEISAE